MKSRVSSEQFQEHINEDKLTRDDSDDEMLSSALKYISFFHFSFLEYYCLLINDRTINVYIRHLVLLDVKSDHNVNKFICHSGFFFIKKLIPFRVAVWHASLVARFTFRFIIFSGEISGCRRTRRSVLKSKHDELETIQIQDRIMDSDSYDDDMKEVSERYVD